jgi:hypothetical protein
MLTKIAETIAHKSKVLPALRTQIMALLGLAGFGFSGCTDRCDASLPRALWQLNPAASR